MAGWIKINRDITRHWIWQNPLYLKAWIAIIIAVNHEEKKVLIQNNIISCERGQSLMCLKSWAKLFGKEWSIQKVRTFFKLLQDDAMIELKGLHKTTRVTVCNYATYQDVQHANNTQITRKQHANNTQLTTNKKNKNEKNEKKEEMLYDFEEFWEDYEKKVGEKNKIAKKWEALKEEERLLIKEHVKSYKLSTPDKKFRKNPETYLNNKSWLDEIITESTSVKSNVKQWINPEPPEYNSRGIRLE